MMGLLVSILILCLIFGVIWWVITLIPLPPPFKQIAMVVVALVFVLILISYLLPIAGVPVWR
jgi:hypothetical protein